MRKRLAAPALLALTSIVACAIPAADEATDRVSSAGVGTVTATATVTAQPPPVFCAWPAAFCGAPATSKLLIVAPSQFIAALQPLVTHKKAIGMPTALVKLEDVLAQFSGADDPEKLKQAIAYAHKNRGTQYVMLVGNGRLLPVRHRFVRQASQQQQGLACAPWLDGTYNPSELYYSNLYHGHTAGSYAPGDPHVPAVVSTGQFEDWDANNDGKFNETMWGAHDALSYNPDQVDGYPDIALGRVPANNGAELTTYVNKVIAFENGTLPSIGGNHFTLLAHQGYPTSVSLSEGAEDSLPNANRPRALLDNPAGSPVPSGWFAGGKNDVALSMGLSSWVSYVGHGWQQGWVASGMDYNAIAALTNGNLPVVMGIACQTGEFVPNVPVDGTYFGKDNKAHYIPSPANPCASKTYDYGQSAYVNLPLVVPPPSPYENPNGSATYSLASAFLFNANGGSIAYFGETQVEPNNGGADLEGKMFGLYTKGNRILGDLFRMAQGLYWLENRNNGDILFASRVELGVMTLFGDPSLKLP